MGMIPLTGDYTVSLTYLPYLFKNVKEKSTNYQGPIKKIKKKNVYFTPSNQIILNGSLISDACLISSLTFPQKMLKKMITGASWLRNVTVNSSH